MRFAVSVVIVTDPVPPLKAVPHPPVVPPMMSEEPSPPAARLNECVPGPVALPLSG